MGVMLPGLVFLTFRVAAVLRMYEIDANAPNRAATGYPLPILIALPPFGDMLNA
jgi:hypothetical protein